LEGDEFVGHKYFLVLTRYLHREGELINLL